MGCCWDKQWMVTSCSKFRSSIESQNNKKEMGSARFFNRKLRQRLNRRLFRHRSHPLVAGGRCASWRRRRRDSPCRRNRPWNKSDRLRPQMTNRSRSASSWSIPWPSPSLRRYIRTAQGWIHMVSGWYWISMKIKLVITRWRIYEESKFLEI